MDRVALCKACQMMVSLIGFARRDDSMTSSQDHIRKSHAGGQIMFRYLIGIALIG